jgi:hypothetical protein
VSGELRCRGSVEIEAETADEAMQAAAEINPLEVDIRDVYDFEPETVEAGG